MDALQFGTLIHAVLEWFGHSGLAESRDEQQVAAGLIRQLERVVTSRYGPRPHPAVQLQVRSCRNRLAAFARVQCEQRALGWQIVETEKAFELPVVVDDRPIVITGRIDRVDRNGELLRVLDYKTGNSVPKPETAHYDKRAGEWRDLQLPLYAWHIMTNGESDRPVPEAGYFALPKNTGQVKPLVTSWDTDMLGEAYYTAREIIERIVRPDASTFNRTDDYRTCANCEYLFVCQRQ